MLSIIIPFKSDTGPRLAAFNYAMAYNKAHFPDAEIIVVEQYTTSAVPSGVTRIAVDAGGSGPMNFPKCVNTGAEAAQGDTLLILDSDTLLIPSVVLEKVLRDKEAFVPMSYQYAIDDKTTAALYAANAPATLDVKTVLTGGVIRFRQSNGGAQLVKKDFFQTVKFDESFVGRSLFQHDFFTRVVKAGGFRGFARDDTRCIHLYHVPERRR